MNTPPDKTTEPTGSDKSIEPSAKSVESTGRRYVESQLQGKEKIVRVAKIHNGIFWKAVLVSLLAIFLLIKVFNLGVFIGIVAGVMWITALLTRHYLMLAVTDKRVLFRNGIIKLEAVQMRHSRIESVELEYPPMGRILGYSTVLISGIGSRVSAIPFIGDGEAFRKELNEILFEKEDS